MKEDVANATGNPISVLELVKQVFRRHQSVTLNLVKFKSFRSISNCPYICV